MGDYLIKNGTVVFEHSIEKVDLLIREGKIEAILENGTDIDHVQVLDASGLVVMPGSIDPHVHYGLHNDVGEDFRKDTPVQVIGGLTSLVCYHRGKEDYLNSLKEWIAKGENNSLVDFAFTLGLVKKQDVENIERFVRELGVTSFKFFSDKQDISDQFYHLYHPEEKLMLDHADLYFCLKKLHELDPALLMCIHCEDRDLFKALEEYICRSDLDPYALQTFGKTRPDFVETTSLAGAMVINGAAEGNLYVVHTSAKKSLQAYEGLRPVGGRVTLETCPQYLIMDENTPCGLDAKVNPPIRTKDDCNAMWEAIRRGTVKTIGTDNAMSYRSERYSRGKDFMSALTGFGSNGLILPTLISEGYHKRNIPLTTISQVNSINTARLFKLKGKGEIRIGYDADLVLLDLNAERTVDESMYGNCDYSIYEGMTFRGWPELTMIRGEIVAAHGKIVAGPGYGKYIFRTVG